MFYSYAHGQLEKDLGTALFLFSEWNNNNPYGIYPCFYKEKECTFFYNTFSLVVYNDDQKAYNEVLNNFNKRNQHKNSVL